MLDIFH
jgi:ferritin heavy chain